MKKPERRTMDMMLSDPLKVPDYSTPAKKKQFVESHCRKLQKTMIEVTGDDDRGFLQSPFGERRQKAILSSLGRAEAEFKSFGLRSIVESFTQNELSPFNNYNHIDSNVDLRIGAALWILDKLRASGKLYDAFKILPDTAGNPDVWYLPTDFHHPCYDNDLIQSVMYVITNRYGERSEVLTVENARGRKPSETWRQLLALLPEEDVKAACEVFKTKIWELATRNMKGQAYYDKAIAQAMRQIQNAQSAVKTGFLMAPQKESKEKDPFAQGMAGLPQLGGLSSLGGFGSPDAFDFARRGEELIERDHDYTRNFDLFLLMDKKQIRRETGSREVAEALEGFRIEDPYELCFALFYLLDTGDDAPWLMRSGCALMFCACDMLPWRSWKEDWDDEDWDSWFDGMQYNRNGWLDRGPVPDQIDFYHEKHGGKNLAQIIYGMCRGVVPTGLHPFEADRQQLIEEGMDEDKARKIADIAELMFLHSFQARQQRPGESAFDWERFENGDDEDVEIAPEVAHATAPEAAANEPQVQADRPQIKLGGYWGKVAAGHGMEVAEADRSNTEAATESEASKAELEQVKAELAEARKQIKGLRTALNNEKHTADADRAKYEHELRSLRMEHRELADLRSLVFNREAENPARLEKVEKQYAYPYETRKRTVVFGGHDTFLKAIKPMLPTVKFVDASNMTYSADIIRNADVVWVQNNCISHSQFWNIVKNCKLAEVQMRYFGFASAEKCAEQLVTEDRK